jgi:REP element-mobilizing transposase RayT
MPRKPRIEYEGAFYHVFGRGNRRERIYWTDGDYAKFEVFMVESAEWSGVKIFSWSQLPNHFHIEIETPEGNLSEFMRRLLTRYAKWFNWRHRLTGHVFQGRYGARICDKERYFLELLRYVTLNPYRGCGKRLPVAGNWKWSSHRYYAHGQYPEGQKQSFAEVLERFSENERKAREAYARFMAEGLKSGKWEDFYQIRGGRFLGDEEFVEDVKRRTGEPVRSIVRHVIRMRGIKELAQWMAEHCGVDLPLLRSLSQNRSVSRWRQALVYVGRKYYRFPCLAMGRYLNRDGTAISQMLRRRRKSLEHFAETKAFQKSLE